MKKKRSGNRRDRAQRIADIREDVMTKDSNTRGRGFASMDEGKQRDIASKGGSSVPNEKRSFSQDSGLAAAAGRKGGGTFLTRSAAFPKTVAWRPKRAA
ncbi:KGG domain-containing protein, partial [Nitrospirillum viridazoti]|uniref:KGG domain-containing protein n=1 Tax=Nitrospirillum viridazoti TaxID=3144925 RepID=UPI003CE5AEAC